MLTGDRAATAEPLARALGITEVRAGLLPEEKLAAVQELKAGGKRRVAMVGDGVNDAPSLAAADVSVAMGARGSDAALEQAAVVLMNDRLENFFVAHELSRRTERVIRQNLVLSLGTVVLMVGASLFGAVPLALGVAAHEGSTVLVVLNSLRLLLSKRTEKRCSMKKSPRSLLSPSVLVWLPSLVAIVASAVVMVDRAHAQSPAGGGKLPPFLKVDGIYYLDGNEDDLVKVLELSPETGWIRVQAKGTESWVNVANLSTVTPVSKDAAAKLQLREEADFILTGAQRDQRCHRRLRVQEQPAAAARASSGKTSASSSSLTPRCTIPTART